MKKTIRIILKKLEVFDFPTPKYIRLNIRKTIHNINREQFYLHTFPLVLKFSGAELENQF